MQCVKGHHDCHNKPPVNTSCEVVVKFFNQYDADAIGVYHGGSMIGHVPANPIHLHKCVKTLFEKYEITWYVKITRN